MAKIKRKDLAESVRGRYAPLPFVVLDSEAFIGATHTARSLLYELVRQHDQVQGNNGHLHLVARWLRQRGWKSDGVIRKARDNLIDRGLIVLTRKGGRNIGPDRFALTWLPISSYNGLDLQRGEYRQGKYGLVDDKLPARGARRPGSGQSRKRGRFTASRCTLASANGVGVAGAAPSNGAKTVHSGENAAPSNGDDVIIAIGGCKLRGPAMQPISAAEALSA